MPSMNSSNNTSTQEVLLKRSPVNILIVDDHPENLISLESILEKEGRNIIKAGSGNEALKMAQQYPLALILLDVQMPDIDGFEVAHMLKNNPKTKDINIIFVAEISKLDKRTLSEFENGTVDFLDKPLDASITQAKVAVFERLYLQMEALREKTEKLQAINKQLDEFVYIVSHDLKAPLRGIASLANFIEDDLGANPNPAIADTLNMMKSRCSRMQNLIDAILHYSRMGNTNGTPEPVDINELLKGIMELLIVPSHIKVTIQPDMPVVMAERVKLHEIFQNLISNGIKYNNKEQGTVDVSFKDLGDRYEFAITDNGAGIKEEHHEKIFGIFQTLQPKDKVESTGIGLTIVKKLVEQKGGKITLVSKPGEGSAFKFTWKK